MTCEQFVNALVLLQTDRIYIPNHIIKLSCAGLHHIKQWFFILRPSKNKTKKIPAYFCSLQECSPVIRGGVCFAKFNFLVWGPLKNMMIPWWMQNIKGKINFEQGNTPPPSVHCPRKFLCQVFQIREAYNTNNTTFRRNTHILKHTGMCRIFGSVFL